MHNVAPFKDLQIPSLALNICINDLIKGTGMADNFPILPQLNTVEHESKQLYSIQQIPKK